MMVRDLIWTEEEIAELNPFDVDWVKVRAANMEIVLRRNISMFRQLGCEMLARECEEALK